MRKALRRASPVDTAYEFGEEAQTHDAPTLPAKFLQKHALQAEYARICRTPIDGIYVVPSASDDFQWFGVVFIRAGVFSGGIFRFVVNIQKDFPNTISLPEIIFDLPVFHPHISAGTNALDLTRYFPDDWKKEKHHIQYALLVAQRVFFSLETDPETCANIRAAELWRDDKQRFKEFAKECVNQSRAHVYDDPNSLDPNAIKFTPWDSSVHDKIRLQMKLGPTTAGGLSWLDPNRLTCMVEPLQQAVDLQPTNLVNNSIPIERLDLSGISDVEYGQESEPMDVSVSSSVLPDDIEEVSDV